MVPTGDYSLEIAVLSVSVLAAFVGVFHAMRKTSGSVKDLLIIWVAYYMLTVLPTFLLLRFGLVLPTIVLVVIVGEALIRGDGGTEAEGFYPDFIIVTPVILLLLCLFAGIEAVLRTLV